jgi:hypothetical protein
MNELTLEWLQKATVTNVRSFVRAKLGVPPETG